MLPKDSERPRREVVVHDDYVTVEHEGDGWWSYATIKASSEGSKVSVGDMTLRVTGNKSGCLAKLTYKGRVLWEGDYTAVEEALCP